MLDRICDNHEAETTVSDPTRVPLDARIDDLLRTLTLTREEINSLNSQLDRLVTFCGAEAWVYKEKIA